MSKFLTFKSTRIFLLIPTALAAIYWGVIASDRYESNSRVVVQRSAQDTGGDSPFASLIGFGNSSTKDALMMKEHILSQDMLEKLESHLNLRAHYSSAEHDWFSRLPQNASSEDFYEYFLNHVHVNFDEPSSIVQIQAESFDAKMSKKVVSFLLQESETFINKVSQQLANGQVEFASVQLDKTYQRLNEATQNLIAFQNQHGTVSPEGESELISSIVSGMEAEIAEKSAQLSTLRSYLNNSSPEIRVLKSQIESLKSQVESEKTKLLGNKGEPLNELNARFQELKTELQFTQDTYGATLTALETAKLEAARKLKHLIVIDSPSLPDEAKHPRRLYNFFTFVVITILLYWIAKLIVATVKDHND